MIIKNVVPNKLHEELIKAGIQCNVSHNLVDGRYFVGECEITFVEGTDMDLIQQAIDAHDPTPLPPPITEAERIAIAEQAINDLMMIMMMTGGMQNV